MFVTGVFVSVASQLNMCVSVNLLLWDQAILLGRYDLALTFLQVLTEGLGSSAMTGQVTKV